MMVKKSWLALASVAGVTLGLALTVFFSTLPATEVTVYKSPTCDCCKKWVRHLQDNGFAVSTHDITDVAPYKVKLGVAPELASCHTAVVGGYVIEGHVPAHDIHRMLSEHPDAKGLAVPGMPMGSPGMEGPYKDAYDVLLIDNNGQSSVYASH